MPFGSKWLWKCCSQPLWMALFEPQAVRPVVKYVHYLSPGAMCHAVEEQLWSLCNAPIRWNGFLVSINSWPLPSCGVEFQRSMRFCDERKVFFWLIWILRELVFHNGKLGWSFVLLCKPAPGRLGSTVVVGGVALAGGSRSGLVPDLPTANAQLLAWTATKLHSLLRCQVW